MPADVTTALVELSTVFASLKLRWYVFGAQAVIAAGVPRLTADIDVTVEAKASAVPTLLDALRGHGFTLRDVGEILPFIAETRVIPAAHTASTVPIDIILAGPGLEEEMMERVQIRTVRDVAIPFIATADLIALKLLAARDKDLEDVRALVRAAPKDLSLAEARERVRDLGAIAEDGTMLATFDRIVGAAPKTEKKTKRRAR